MKFLDFGSVNIDYIYKVPHFVRPGETMSVYSMTRNAGGKGFNQSVALAKAGCEVYHAGHIGVDGEFLSEMLENYGVKTDYLTKVEAPTGNAVIQVDESGDNCIILYGGANQTMEPDFIGTVLNGFSKGDVLILQNEINRMDEILSVAHELGMIICLNPAPMNDRISLDKMKLADWLVLNETEAWELTGEKTTDKQLETLESLFPDSSFLLTLGAKGAVCRSAGEDYRIGACRVEAVDTTAAGDTFIGFFIASIAEGNTPSEALLTATRASALTVMKEGAAQSIPSLDEVLCCSLRPESF